MPFYALNILKLKDILNTRSIFYAKNVLSMVCLLVMQVKKATSFEAHLHD